jgi:ADP-ribose pyrophosphatase YjhB (NUDIX family)
MLVVRPHGVGAWFLPGGLVEPGESLAEAAAREVPRRLGSWLMWRIFDLRWW